MKRQPKTIRPKDTIALPLSPQERDFILKETFPEENVLKRLRLATVEEGRHVYRFTYGELEDLHDSIAYAANHTEDENVERKLDMILNRVSDLLNAHFTAEDEVSSFEQDSSQAALLMIELLAKTPPFGNQPPPELMAIMEKLARELGDIKLAEEFQRALQTLFHEHAHKSVDELGGLSPHRFSQLMADEWDGRGVIRLNHDLALAEIKGADILSNARILLRAVLESGGVKATVKGNLPRKFVREMLEAMIWAPGYVEEVLPFNKVLNEADVPPLNVTRILLDLSHVIRKVKGVFKVTKKHQALLKEEKAGQLYALLFWTHFQRFNLGYLDWMPEMPMFQETVAYPLFMLSRDDGSWKRPEDLAQKIMLPPGLIEIPDLRYKLDEVNLLRCRVINPLISFGLLEKRFIPSNDHYEYLKPYEVRKADLFDKFLRFSFD